MLPQVQARRGGGAPGPQGQAAEQVRYPRSSWTSTFHARYIYRIGLNGPKELLWFEYNSDGGGHIAGCVWLNYGKKPTLVLHGNRKTEIRTQRIIGPDTRVCQRATTRKELLANLLVAEVELQTVARAKPVVRPSLRALSAASDPATDQVSVVCVTVTPGPVLIKRTRKFCVSACTSGYIRINPFDTKIQPRDAGEV